MIYKLNLNRGFILVEVLVVIAIIAILAAVVVLIINPLELIHRSRDATRMKDLDNLQQAINVTIQEVSMSSNSLLSILCKESGEYPCTGSSHTGLRLTDGTGWVKANLAIQNSVTVATLPVDSLNNTDYHYTYCADKDSYELNTTLESDTQKSKMVMDGGNDNDKYEVGSNLNLIASIEGSCEY